MSNTKSGVGYSLEKTQRSGVQLSERLASLSSTGSQLKDLLEHDSSMVWRGLRGAVNWPPIMPEKASLSDSRGKFFQAGLLENVSVSSFSFQEEKRESILL